MDLAIYLDPKYLRRTIIKSSCLQLNDFLNNRKYKLNVKENIHDNYALRKMSACIIKTKISVSKA